MRVFSEVLGGEVKVPEKPGRIVSLAENVTETLFMLGAGERIMGVSSYCRRPQEASEKPRIGGYLRVNYGKLEELKPDLILTTTGVQLRLARELQEKGYPVYPIPLPKTVYGIIDNVLEIGLVIDAVEAARTLASRLMKRVGELEKRGGALRVYVELELGGPVTIGASSYLSHALHIIGARNIFDHVRRGYFTPNLKEVEELNPEAIIYEPRLGEREPEERIRRLIRERGWSWLTAVESNRVSVTRGDFLAHYGPSFIEDALTWLTKITK